MEKASTVTVSLPPKNNIYLRQSVGVGANQEPRMAAAAIDDTAEISIFDAEKYFSELNALEAPKLTVNGGGNRVSPAERISSVGTSIDPQRFSSASSSVDGYSSIYRNYRTRSFRSAATPTASSEASWNSQTGLLAARPGSISVSVQNPASDKKSRGTPSSPTTPTWRLGFRKKCPCSCKKSVQVNDKSVRRKPENPLPPPPQIPPLTIGGSSKSCSTTSSASEYRLSGNNSVGATTTTTISMEKARHDSFQENWYQTRQRTSRDTTSFSSASTESLVPPKLQAMGIRTSFTEQRVGSGTNNNANGFTFPILGANQGIKLKDPAMADKEMGRDSLEIFKPSQENPSGRKNSDNFMRIPASNNFTAKIAVDVIDDGASDASSDLFELESFSTATTATTNAYAPATAMFLYRRDAIEEDSVDGNGMTSSSDFQVGLRNSRFSINPVNVGIYEPSHRRSSLDEPMTPRTECAYEPSEASIDWSVTTAEGFDRASVAYASEADYREFRDPPAPVPEKTRRKSSGNGLLTSCRCEKAVSVGRPVPARPISRPVGGGSGGENGRHVATGAGLSSSSTLAMWAVGHKL